MSTWSRTVADFASCLAPTWRSACKTLHWRGSSSLQPSITPFCLEEFQNKRHPHMLGMRFEIRSQMRKCITNITRWDPHKCIKTHHLLISVSSKFPKTPRSRARNATRKSNHNCARGSKHITHWYPRKKPPLKSRSQLRDHAIINTKMVKQNLPAWSNEKAWSKPGIAAPPSGVSFITFCVFKHHARCYPSTEQDP